jgi:hypothetical protein
MEEICMNCDYFNETNPETHAGQCRRLPPRGIDTKSMPTGTDPLHVFPVVDDGSQEHCGQFRPIINP